MTKHELTHDETMRMLAAVPEMFSWTAFKPILYSPERLKAWLTEQFQPEPEGESLDPDDPVVEERATINSDQELKAMEFWAELTPEEREKVKAAFRDLWGSTETLPLSLR